MKKVRITIFCCGLIFVLGLTTIHSILKSKQSIKSLKQFEKITAYLEDVNFKIMESTSQHYEIDSLFDLSMFEDRQFILYYRFFKTSCHSCVINALNVLITLLNEYENHIIIGGTGQNFEAIHEYMNTNNFNPSYYNMENFHRMFPVDQLGQPYFSILYKIENRVFILNLWIDFNDTKLLGILDQCKALLSN